MEKALGEAMKSIGERVAERRKELKWSQETLAKKIRQAFGLATGQSTIGNIELGDTKSPTIIYELASVLGVEEKWLKTGVGPKERGERLSDDAVAELIAHILDATNGVLQGFGFSADEANALLEIVQAVAEARLPAALGQDGQRARHILGAAEGGKFLKQKRFQFLRS